jgi:predicted hydrocarbon binding protein/KaiC/GvpD/RAD55 family RecA-like ATPase
MEKRGLSLAKIQEVPRNSLILLAGPPGAGKSTFCHQAVLNSLAMDRPIILVTTEQGPAEVAARLRESGMVQLPPAALHFVDAFAQTVGLATSGRADTIHANCEDLNSISMAIARQQQRIGRRDILLAFDSLTSPYLFNKEEMFRFMRLCLLKFAAEGNSVVALMDEGCGKEEDLVAMMSVSDGVIRMEMEEDRQLLSVVKHPSLKPSRIEVPVAARPRVISSCFDTEYTRRQAEIAARRVEVTLRPQVGDYVSIAWRDLIFWSGMLWDPKRFPTMMYELTKYSEDPSNLGFDMLSLFPWHRRLLFRLFVPRSFSKAEDMARVFGMSFEPQITQHRIGTIEYLGSISKTDVHTFRVHESYECCGLENIGTSLAIMKPAMMAGMLQGMEELIGGPERDWNAVETKCIGRGDPHCEFQLVPGEIEELRESLEKGSEIIERIHGRLMDHLLGFALHGKPLMERPKLGSGVHIHEVQHVTAAPLVSERLKTVFRMGGARAGKMLGERLLGSGLTEQDAVGRTVDLLEHCKVGQVTLRLRSGQALGETIRISENCERFGIRTAEPSCYFTTGFLNGLFSAVKNQHVREIKCIAAGDPYCEWEII